MTSELNKVGDVTLTIYRTCSWGTGRTLSWLCSALLLLVLPLPPCPHTYKTYFKSVLQLCPHLISSIQRVHLHKYTLDLIYLLCFRKFSQLRNKTASNYYFVALLLEHNCVTDWEAIAHFIFSPPLQ